MALDALNHSWLAYRTYVAVEQQLDLAAQPGLRSLAALTFRVALMWVYHAL